MTEEEYFARENTETLRKLHRDAVKHLTQMQKDQLRSQHANRCAECGMEMHKLHPFHGVTLLRCFECGGTFIDAANAKKLQVQSKKKDHANVEAILNLFTHDEP